MISRETAERGGALSGFGLTFKFAISSRLSLHPGRHAVRSLLALISCAALLTHLVLFWTLFQL